MPSFLFCLFIVSISVHACNGRSLGIELDKRITEESPFSKISGELPVPRVLPRNLSALLKKVGGSETATSGNKVIASSQTWMQQAAEQERKEREKGQSLQASDSDDTEETVGPGEGDALEDAVVMDYEQPHWKPPIHNENF